MNNLTPDLTDLYRRVVEANSDAEQAIAKYNAHNAGLVREANGDPGRYHILKRDDLILAGLGSGATFRIANAQRLASFLQVELLGSLVRQAEARAERQRV